MAWVSISGLTSLAFCDETLDKIIGGEGKLISRGVSCIRNNQFVSPELCISTRKCEKIKLSRKVVIDDQMFEVLIQEDTKCHHAFKKFNGRL